MHFIFTDVSYFVVIEFNSNLFFFIGKVLVLFRIVLSPLAKLHIYFAVGIVVPAVSVSSVIGHCIQVVDLT